MKQGYYKLSIKPDIKPSSDGLAIMEQIGAYVMIVVAIYGGILLMGVI